MAAHKGHRWDRYKFIPWPVCMRCGLVALKNEITRLAIKAMCPADAPDRA